MTEKLERRGIEHIDRNADILLVRVPIKELSAALATLAVEWQPEILDSEIEMIAGKIFYTYCVRGHLMLSSNGDYGSINQPLL